ncbi:MAG: oligosaccharide repeat unit polymerase [Flavobacteriaceae bacterium]|nr:oligosaccharide repeat unit polymerase [Flavobacteriaceae bacterium]
MKIILRDILLVFYAVISLTLFITFRADTFVYISFLLNFSAISLITFHHLYIEKYFSPFISAYIVFNYLFFLLAPIVQIGSFNESSFLFANNFPYSEELTIKTNMFVFCFHGVFFFFYMYFKKKGTTQLNNIKPYNHKPILPLTIVVLFFLSVTTFLLSFGFIQDEISRPNWMPSSYSVSQLLLYKKVLFVIPLGAIILCFQYLRNDKKSKNAAYIFVFLLMLCALLIWFKNPLTEKRNALGPIYITLIYLFYPKLLNSNTKTLSFLFFSMIILFPLVQIFTHVEYSLAEIIENPEYITREFSAENFSIMFNTLNYDAFSNISVVIDYVSKNGFSWGYQLLGGILFFVPRGIWANKPISSGQLVGEYVISDYGFHFSNLSNPLIAEGYLNFGFLGILLMAIFLSYFIIKLLIWFRQNNYQKKIVAFYFAIHLIFFLRGDFTNGFAYFIGTVFGVMIIPKLVDMTIRAILKRSK